MSHVTVKMFPARTGDCFLVSLGLHKKTHILVDCGYAETYRDHLKEELRKIAFNGEAIDLMVITHIDQDHILGALEFLSDNNKARFIDVKEIWHNSYRHLQFDKAKVEKIPAEELAILDREVVLGSSFVERQFSRGAIRDWDISATQGSMLSALILDGGYPWNTSFEGKAVSCENRCCISKNQYTITILSPDTDKLDRLARTWVRELKQHKRGFVFSNERIFDDAYEFYLIRQEAQRVVDSEIAALNHDPGDSLEKIAQGYTDKETDNSATNGSSISFLIEYSGKRLLFLGDAHPDIISKNLAALNESRFDLVKVPHHGSKQNLTRDLVVNLESVFFLISTNGERYNHPDIESLARIICSKRDRPKKLVFNYETNTSKALNNSSWKRHYNYEVHVSSEKTVTTVEL